MTLWLFTKIGFYAYLHLPNCLDLPWIRWSFPCERRGYNRSWRFLCWCPSKQDCRWSIHSRGNIRKKHPNWSMCIQTNESTNSWVFFLLTTGRRETEKGAEIRKCVWSNHHDQKRSNSSSSLRGWSCQLSRREIEKQTKTQKLFYQRNVFSWLSSLFCILVLWWLNSRR